MRHLKLLRKLDQAVYEPDEVNFITVYEPFVVTVGEPVVVPV
jgi:hypothetical protein